MTPAPTSHTILCNLAQQLQSSLDVPPVAGVDTVAIPRAHLRRWRELLHSAVMLLDAPLAVARTRALCLLALGCCALGWLACWVFS